MKNLILLTLTLLLLSSCITRRACLRKFPPHTWESTTIETIMRPQVISLYVPPIELAQGSPIVIAEGQPISSDVSRLETDFAVSLAWILNDSLFHRLTQKPQTVTDTVYVTDTVTVTEKGEVVRVPVRGALWWIGLIASAGIVVGIVYLIRKWL